MKKDILKAVIISFAIALIPSISSAADRTEENVTPRSEKLFMEPQIPQPKRTKKIRLDTEKSLVEKGKFKFLLAETVGYDNNSSLDSSREGDYFAQTFFRASFISPMSEKTQALFDYEMMNLMYASNSNLDLLRNGIRLGMDHKLTEEINLSAAYSIDYIDYLKRKNDDVISDDYIDNAVEFKVRQALPNKMFHSATYDILFRSYNERFTRFPTAAYTTKERNDFRNTLGYEIGKFFASDLVRVKVEYFNNNSNEQYLKYYDYDSYKIGASLTHIFNDKITGLLSVSRQFRDYRTRTLIADANTTELEKTGLATAALFYAMNKSVSFGLNYTYRQNTSNEPLDKYSGSLISLSTYIKF